MFVPVERTSQVIPVDYKYMNQMLGQDQARYDAANAGINEFEDAASSIPVTTGGMEAKDMFLNKTKESIDAITAKYGGDAGAASKEIARFISKAKADPLVQLMPYQYQLAEEERKMVSQLGPNAINLRPGVGTKNLINKETGQVINKEELHPSVIDRRDITKHLQANYGELSRKMREGLFQAAKGADGKAIPGLMDRWTTRGLTQAEADALIPQMIEDIKAMSPELAKAIEEGNPVAMQEARNMANQLVMGQTASTMQDPGYNPSSSDNAGDPFGLLNLRSRQNPTKVEGSIEDVNKAHERVVGDIEKLKELQTRLSKGDEFVDNNLQTASVILLGKGID